MSLLTLLGFLFGYRPAIEQAAADPWAVWVGLALLASTGLARSWNLRDLRHEPWHLALPLAAALVLSFALFLTLWLVLLQKGAGPPPFWAGYRSLLGLFLLTAPLAWLYALPLQQFLSPERALRARLGLLAVVAGWRVAVMTRAVAVLLDGRTAAAFCIVMLVADVALLAGLIATGVARSQQPASTPRLLEVMGAITPPAASAKEKDPVGTLTCSVAALAVFTLPVWSLVTANALVSAATWRELATAPGPWPPPTAAVWALAGGAVLFFLGLLPWGQPPQRLRGRVEHLLRRGEVAAALREMSAHNPSDFPPGWTPPPIDRFREPPTLLHILGTVADTAPADWVRAAYLERLRAYLADPLWYWPYDADLEQLAALLARLPEGPELARRIQEVVHDKEGPLAPPFGRRTEGTDGEPQFDFLVRPKPEPTGRRKETVAALWELAGQGRPKDALAQETPAALSAPHQSITDPSSSS
jgi:hypothetical protein